MSDEIPVEELELLAGAFAELRAFGAELTPREAWFPRLLIGLVNATLREYQHLKAGLEHSTAMVAWACRNLLDLHIYARYVLASVSNARRFSGERLSEGIESYDTFQTWLARNDPALVPPALEEAIRSLIEQRSEAGLAEAPPLRLTRIAAEVGLADEYANMSRLSLALARPNAFSILSEGEADHISRMRPILFRAGAGHGMEIFRVLKEHVAEFGVQPRA
jgi:hypothetical protein